MSVPSTHVGAANREREISVWQAVAAAVRRNSLRSMQGSFSFLVPIVLSWASPSPSIIVRTITGNVFGNRHRDVRQHAPKTKSAFTVERRVLLTWIRSAIGDLLPQRAAGPPTKCELPLGYRSARSRGSLVVVKNSTIFEISNTVVEPGRAAVRFPFDDRFEYNQVESTDTEKVNETSSKQYIVVLAPAVLVGGFPAARSGLLGSLAGRGNCCAAAVQRNGRGGITLGASALPAAGRSTATARSWNWPMGA